MREAFTMAHEFTAQWEGGLSDHPQDAGGITHYGVSYTWLKQLEANNRAELQKIANSADGCNAWDERVSPYDFSGDGRVDEADIRACTAEQAKELFHKHFWLPLQCDSLPVSLAVFLYDSAVNMGAPRAVRLLQECCNRVGEAHLDVFTPLSVDGIIGKKTCALACSLRAYGLDFYTARMCVRQRVQFYVRITQKNPQQKVFLRGWKNRCQGLLEHLALLERDVQ